MVRVAQTELPLLLLLKESRKGGGKEANRGQGGREGRREAEVEERERKKERRGGGKGQGRGI